MSSLAVHPIPITAGQEKSQPLVERGIQGSIPSSAYWLAVPSHGPSLCLHLPATNILAKCFEIPRKKVTEVIACCKVSQKVQRRLCPALGMQERADHQQVRVADTSLNGNRIILPRMIILSHSLCRAPIAEAAELQAPSSKSPMNPGCPRGWEKEFLLQH